MARPHHGDVVVAPESRGDIEVGLAAAFVMIPATDEFPSVNPAGVAVALEVRINAD